MVAHTLAYWWQRWSPGQPTWRDLIAGLSVAGLLLPEAVAKWVVGISISIFVVMLGTGIVLWWPKRRQERKQRGEHRDPEPDGELTTRHGLTGVTRDRRHAALDRGGRIGQRPHRQREHGDGSEERDDARWPAHDATGRRGREQARTRDEGPGCTCTRGPRDRAPDRSRTCDLRYRKPALYPLSYGGNSRQC